jgi:hypothetical protein
VSLGGGGLYETYAIFNHFAGGHFR